MGNYCNGCTQAVEKEDNMTMILQQQFQLTHLTEEKDLTIIPIDKINSVRGKLFVMNAGQDYYEQCNRDESNIVTVQAFYRGFVLRKCYMLTIKPQLKAIQAKMIQKTIDSYLNSAVIQAENTFNTPFNIDNWKTYYSNNAPQSSHLNKDYGPIFNTNLLIKLDPHNLISSCYIGNTNISNQRHGIGCLIIFNTGKYEGMWRNDSFTGYGRLIDSEGTIYEGLFIDWLLNGKGMKYTLTKWSYVGDFRDSLREGEGIEETDDHIYKGHFENDKKNGQGKVNYKLTKDAYEGTFEDNEITGYGLYHWGTGQKFEGDFVKGKMHGRGKYTWENGGVYEGEYVNNIKEGMGVFRWIDGRIFKGPFKNGKPNGNGVLIVEGKEYDVEFNKGKLRRSINDILLKDSKLSIGSDR